MLPERLTEADRRAFAAQYARVQRDLTAAGSDSVRRSMALLDDLRAEVRAIIDDAARRNRIGSTLRFEQRAIGQISGQIDKAFTEWGEGAGKALRDAMSASGGLGAAVTAEAFQAAGVQGLAFPQINQQVLATLANSAVSILSESTDLMVDKVTSQITRAAAGLQPASRARNNIERLMRTDTVSRAGGTRRRIGFAYQAEAIQRTETNRIFSVAQQAASEKIRTQIPGLRKRWVDASDSRVRGGHTDVAIASADNPILIGDLFTVTDRSRSEFNQDGFWTRRTGPSRRGRQRVAGGAQRVYRGRPGARSGAVVVDEMLHPRDPSASAGNVISCRCWIMEVVPGQNFDQEIDRIIRELDEEGL